MKLSTWHERRDRKNEPLRRRTKNPFKIKSHLIVDEIEPNPYAYLRWYRPIQMVEREWVNNARHRYFRPIHTRPEMRWNEAHCRDIDPEIVRGRRRKRLLPDSYWDIPCSMWKTDKSWKHNSKRPKQWKRYSNFESHT